MDQPLLPVDVPASGGGDGQGTVLLPAYLEHLADRLGLLEAGVHSGSPAG
jgi:hypothetical protein